MWATEEETGRGAERRHQLDDQPARQEEVDVPTDFVEAGSQGLYAGAKGFGETGFGLADGGDVDADAADVEAGDLGVGRDALVEVGDSPADCGAKLAHRVEHAGIIHAIGTELDEDETLEAKTAGEAEIVVERCMGGLVAKVTGVDGLVGQGPKTWKCASHAPDGAVKAGSRPSSGSVKRLGRSLWRDVPRTRLWRRSTTIPGCRGARAAVGGYRGWGAGSRR